MEGAHTGGSRIFKNGGKPGDLGQRSPPMGPRDKALSRGGGDKDPRS